MDYRIDVCHVTGVPPLSVCKVMCQNFESFSNSFCMSHGYRLTGFFIINMCVAFFLNCCVCKQVSCSLDAKMYL